MRAAIFPSLGGSRGRRSHLYSEGHRETLGQNGRYTAQRKVRVDEVLQRAEGPRAMTMQVWS